MPDSLEPTDEVARFLKHLQEHYPQFSTAVEKNRAANPGLFLELGGHALSWARGALGEAAGETIAKGYCHFVTEQLREQFAYERRGRYANRGYQEVFDAVYDNDGYMNLYHWGVYGTLFLWAHHLMIYDFFRRRFLERHVPQGAALLEFGSGIGIWSLLSATLRPDVSVLGMDISKSSLDIATALCGAAGLGGRVRFEVRDATIPPGEGRADAALSCFLLEHMENPQDLLHAVQASLRPGAPLFLTTAITAAEVDHIYEFRSEGEALGLLEGAGFRVLEMFSSAPEPQKRMAFLPRSVAFTAVKKTTANW